MEPSEDEQRRDALSEGKDHSPLKMVGIAGALGFEMVGFVLGGAFVGNVLDERLGTGPWILLTMVALGLLTSGLHIYAVARRFMS